MKRFLEYFKMALSNIGHRKMRAYLTMIGIFIGITAVVAIISLGQGLQGAINDQFSSLGTDKIWIQPGTSSFGTDSVVLDESDKRIIEDEQGVASVAGISYENARVEYKDQVAFMTVMGVSKEDDSLSLINEIYQTGTNGGRPLNSKDNSKVALGYNYAVPDKIFKTAIKIGDKIVINNNTFKVAGFNKKYGNSGDDGTVLIISTAFKRVFNKDIKDDYKFLIAKIASGENPKTVADRIKHDLDDERGLSEGDEDFTLKTTEELMDSFNSILSIVQVVIVGLAAISLLIGGIGIMNTMYTAVVERTQEIGVMKAIGAKNREVLSIFLIESGMLGLMGGLIGVVLGLGISKLVELGGLLWIGTPYLRMWWSWGLIGSALAFSFFVGMLSGIAPAYQASKKKPVDSLRYE